MAAEGSKYGLFRIEQKNFEYNTKERLEFTRAFLSDKKIPYHIISDTCLGPLIIVKYDDKFLKYLRTPNGFFYFHRFIGIENAHSLIDALKYVCDVIDRTRHKFSEKEEKLKEEERKLLEERLFGTLPNSENNK